MGGCGKLRKKVQKKSEKVLDLYTPLEYNGKCRGEQENITKGNQMNATTKNEIDKTLEIAMKQLNNAIKNIEKAEELAFNNREDNLYDDLQKHEIEIAKGKDGLFILSCMIKHHADVEGE